MKQYIQLEIGTDVEDSIDRYLQVADWGRRGVGDGNKTYQKWGIIGECEVYKYFFGKYPKLAETHGKADPGYDFIWNDIRVDVKTTGGVGRFSPDKNFLYFALQKKAKADIVIICYYDITRNILTLGGWFPKAALIDERRFIKAGTRVTSNGYHFHTVKFDAYSIRFSELNKLYWLFEEVPQG